MGTFCIGISLGKDGGKEGLVKAVGLGNLNAGPGAKLKGLIGRGFLDLGLSSWRYGSTVENGSAGFFSICIDGFLLSGWGLSGGCKTGALLRSVS